MIFICMEFSMEEYKNILDRNLSSRYSFIQSVNVNSLKIRLGLLHGDFTITLTNGTMRDMTHECKQKCIKGDRVSYWVMASCFRRKFNLVKIERDIESMFWDLYGVATKNLGVIKTDYILN